MSTHFDPGLSRDPLARLRPAAPAEAAVAVQRARLEAAMAGRPAPLLVATAGPVGPRISRRRRWARGLAGLTVTGLVAGGGLAVAGRDGSSKTSDQLICNEKEGWNAGGVAFDPRRDDPVQACIAGWPGTPDGQHIPAPAASELIACVDDRYDGAIQVHRATAGTCADHHERPYTGPTDEQLRILDFRDALTTSLPACAKLADIEAKVAELAAAHKVGRWTVKWAAPDGWPGCVGAQVTEAARTVWVAPAAPPGEGTSRCYYPPDQTALGCPPPR